MASYEIIITSDAAVLAIKAGSACVLRGGKEAFRSASAIVAAMQEGLCAQRRIAAMPYWYAYLRKRERIRARGGTFKNIR